MVKLVTLFALIGITVSTILIGLGYFFPFLQLKEVILFFFVMIFLAVLYQYGNDLMERLKKLGPMEFFEKKINEIYLDEKFHPAKFLLNSEKKISEEEFFKFQVSDIFINFLEFSNVNISKLKNKDKIIDILRSVGIIAFSKQDYFRAISRFEKLKELEGNSYEKSYNIGLSYLKIADKEQDSQKKKIYFNKSLENFKSAKDIGKDQFLVYYNIAWVLDELGNLEEAIENNRKCLQLNSEFYPAKYNIAVSLTKKGKYEEAFKQLKEIPITPANREIWETAKEDNELKALRTNEKFGKEVMELIEKSLEKS